MLFSVSSLLKTKQPNIKPGLITQNYEIRQGAPRKRAQFKTPHLQIVIKYLLIQNENEKCLGETVPISKIAHNHKLPKD